MAELVFDRAGVVRAVQQAVLEAVLHRRLCIAQNPLAQPGNRVPPTLYKKLATFFNPEQIVALTAFAGLMVATNIINNVLEVELDENLYEFRA